MPSADLPDRLRAVDPARDLDHAGDAGEWRERVLARAIASSPASARVPTRGRRRPLVIAAAATAVTGFALALLPATSLDPATDGDRAAIPGSPAAAFAQELRRPGVLHAVTVTRGTVDAQGRLDSGGPPVRLDLWYAVDGSRHRERMTIGDHPPTERVSDGRELNTYRLEEGTVTTGPLRPTDPDAPRQAGTPFAARTLKLADELESGRYVRLGGAVVDGKPVTVVGTDDQPGDPYPVDQRFFLADGGRRLVRIELLELPLPAGTQPSEYRWQRDDVLRFEVIDAEDAEDHLDVSADVKADSRRLPPPPPSPPTLRAPTARR
jgi:hypothetical protein